MAVARGGGGAAPSTLAVEFVAQVADLRPGPPSASRPRRVARAERPAWRSRSGCGPVCAAVSRPWRSTLALRPRRRAGRALPPRGRAGRTPLHPAVLLQALLPGLLGDPACGRRVLVGRAFLRGGAPWFRVDSRARAAGGARLAATACCRPRPRRRCSPRLRSVLLVRARPARRVAPLVQQLRIELRRSLPEQGPAAAAPRAGAAPPAFAVDPLGRGASGRGSPRYWPPPPPGGRRAVVLRCRRAPVSRSGAGCCRPSGPRGAWRWRSRSRAAARRSPSGRATLAVERRLLVPSRAVALVIAHCALADLGAGRSRSEPAGAALVLRPAARGGRPAPRVGLDGAACSPTASRRAPRTRRSRRAAGRRSDSRACSCTGRCSSRTRTCSTAWRCRR